MKNKLKNTFKEATLHKAPDGFTDSVMHKIVAKRQTYGALLPKPFLWFLVLSFLVGILAIVFTQAQQLNAGTMGIQNFISVYYELLPSLILPLCIGLLLLIQQVFHYRKIT